jgi:hypothetical protein
VFKTQPKLRLQDLASTDIQCYIEDQLQNNKRMVLLCKMVPKDARQMARNVQEMTPGVFLWVELVIKDLLRVLRNQDSISDLRNRLDTTPPDLGNLYAKKLACVESIYRETCSKIFQIYQALDTITNDLEFMYRSMIAKSNFALKATIGDYQFQSARRISKFDISSQGVGFDGVYDLDCLFEYVESILYTRCSDLMEVEIRHSSLSHGASIEYIHRTVGDFVRSPDVWETILNWSPKFDPHLASTATAFLAFKTNCNARRTPNIALSAGRWKTVRLYAGKIKATNSEPQELLLDTFYRASIILHGQHWTSLAFPDNWEPQFSACSPCFTPF